MAKIPSYINKTDKRLHHSAESYSGQILLATPNMSDPRFSRAVIFICGHDENGAMGLMINKPKAGLHISDLLDRVGISGQVRVTDSRVLSGGPVEIDRGFVLHSGDYYKENSSLKISDTLSLTSTKDILEALVTDQAPKYAMLAVGYAGWDSGQLEKELAQNAWLIMHADDGLVFSEDLDGKWHQALNVMGIDPAALASKGGRA